MRTFTMQRHLITSRVPSRMGFRISHFSTNVKLLAVRRAPQVKLLERQRKWEAKQPLSPPPPEHPEEHTDIMNLPKSILTSAHLNGQLSVSEPEAMKILNEFKGSKLISGTPKELCLKHKIHPRVLTQLARVLIMTQSEPVFSTAHGLFFAATELEDPGAALMLVLADLKSKKERPKLLHLKKAYQVFERLIGAENPVAFYLQGKIHEREGKNKLALKMYTKSTEISADGYTGAETLDISLGDAWKAISRLRRQGNDMVGAKEAIKKAAIDCDDSEAYLHLATRFTDPSSDEYEQYLLKAAISAQVDAAGELGAYYFKKLRKTGAFNQNLVPPSLKDSTRPISLHIPKRQSKDQEEWDLWTNTFEWLSVASESKIASSQIYYAIVLRALQKPNFGLLWLVEASQTAKLRTTVAWLKDKWFSNELDLSNFDLEEILQDNTNRLKL